MKSKVNKETIFKLYEERYGYTDIAKMFGVSPQRIHQIFTGYNTQGNTKNKRLPNCQICHKKSELIHHIDKNPYNNVPRNLMSLCSKCHRNIHKGDKKIFNSIFTKYNPHNKGNRKPDGLPTCCKYHHDHPETLKLGVIKNN